MSKIEYDEFDDEMNPFHPCLACGCEEFSMNWDTGLYECDNCGLTLEVNPNKKKLKPKVKKFRGLKEDDEVY
jgi:transcription elongation factor Elf1